MADANILRSQVGMSLNARRLQLNERFGLNLKLSEFREMYRAQKIRQQKMRSRLGAPKLKPIIEQ